MRARSSRIAPLEWESAFFEKRSGLLAEEADARTIAVEELDAFELVQAKIDVRQADRLQPLLDRGFRLAETEVSYSYAVPHQHTRTEAKTRTASETDVTRCQALVREAFVAGRFRPPWYAEEDSARFYAKWVENAILGSFDDECLLLENGSSLQGLVTMRKLDRVSARVGLLATDASLRGRGLGFSLVSAALGWCADRHLPQLSITTHLANLPAVRLYERSGGVLAAAAYWMYWSKDG